MIGDFRRSFKPTESDRQARATNYLSMLIDSVFNHTCLTCKHNKTVKDYEHGKETSISYCAKLNQYELIKENCYLYEVVTVDKL